MKAAVLHQQGGPFVVEDVELLAPEPGEVRVRLAAAGIPLDGASDHGVSEALYLPDPDANGVELYWDRPRTEWPRGPDGSVAMYTRRLDLDALLAETGTDERQMNPR